MTQKIFIVDKPGKVELKVPFTKTGEEVEVLGLVMGGEMGEYQVEVVAEHKMGPSFGRVMVRGVAGNGAKVSLKGKIKIEKKAQGVDDFLELRVLLLDEKSQAEAEPQLEIEANDVKASHAATVGKIDDEDKFYLMSRGIKEKQAEVMIVEGFLQEVVERVDDESEKKRLQLAIEKYGY